MEVKIGVQHTPREVVLDSAQTPDEVEKAVRDALASADGVLSLVDEKGRRVLIKAAMVGYVEIADADHRRVGFGVGN